MKKGTLTNFKRGKYVGELKNNKPNGQGTHTFIADIRIFSLHSLSKAGDKYVGEFKDGKYNGQGTLKDFDGEIEKGIWKNGLLIK